jgi:hypothetical protein
MHKIAAVLLFVIALATTSDAQDLTTALSISSVGSGISGPYPSAEFRASLPISDRFAVEPFMTLGSKRNPARGSEGFYGVQIRQRIAYLTTRESFVFAAYGLSSYYSNFSNFGTEAPVIGQFGFGVRHRTSRYLAFRSEIDFMTWTYYPFGARFTIGVSLLAKD